MTRFVWLVDIGVLEMIRKGNLKKNCHSFNPRETTLMIEAYSTHQRMESYKAVD